MKLNRRDTKDPGKKILWGACTQSEAPTNLNQTTPIAENNFITSECTTKLNKQTHVTWRNKKSQMKKTRTKRKNMNKTKKT